MKFLQLCLAYGEAKQVEEEATKVDTKDAEAPEETPEKSGDEKKENSISKCLRQIDGQ